ncbi:MAG: hypothetical protein JWP27_2731 [Flaviaesturariibacter sp.]|nr:hypothetical protein [Flaviaesturariibacter sp.]
MKQIRLLFNILAVVLVFGCRPPARVAAPSRSPAGSGTVAAASDTFLLNLLHRSGLFEPILADPARYRVQVIYTKIDRTSGNKPQFTNYDLNVDRSSYFYPASTVKLPVALLALQRVNELASSGLTPASSFITEAGSPGQAPVFNDPSTPDGRPTIAQYIRKILLVSDNDAYNRLFEFLGPDYINKALHGMGYDSAQIIHRLQVSLSEAQNRRTNPVRFFDTTGRLLLAQPEAVSLMRWQQRQTLLGNGYMSRGQVVNAPFDFSKKNRLSLPDLHSILTSLLFPEAVPKKKRFGLTRADYNFVYRYMSMAPSESRFPSYDTSYPDAYSKLLLFGGSGRLENPSVRIFNKEGDAYGFLTDAAYIVDFDNGIEFLLSATIYCNSDAIFNDDHYDYDTVGLPFLKNLGRVLYDYERARPRRHKPDLSPFKMTYGE